mgnify:CR=1 FL=1
MTRAQEGSALASQPRTADIFWTVSAVGAATGATTVLAATAAQAQLTATFSPVILPNIERKIDNVNNGLCDGFYAQAQLVNGVQNAMQQGFMSAEISRANQQAAFMQQLNAMQMQQANCCCETREAIQGVNYNLATQACDTRQTIQNGTRDIIENQNANARAVLDALTAQRIEAKDAKIAEQSQQLFAAQLSASQAAQNETLKAYMSGQLAYYNPRPVPAFPVPAPYQYGNCGTCNC